MAGDDRIADVNFLAMFDEFGVYFTFVNAVIWGTLWLLYRPDPKETHSFTKTLLGFICVNFTYVFTVNVSDRVYMARPAAERVPMYDLGYHLIPDCQDLQLFCDFFAAASVCVICISTIVYARDMKTATQGVQDITVGKLLSLTLHTVTQFPDSRLPGYENGFPLFGYEGLTDRLMSNHIYEFGVALSVASIYFPNHFGKGPRIFVLVVYTLLMISSRGHYTVDCVLAWWTLGAVGRIDLDKKKHKVTKLRKVKGKEPDYSFDEKVGRGFLAFIVCCSIVPYVIDQLPSSSSSPSGSSNEI